MGAGSILYSEAGTMTEIDERTILLVEDEAVIAMAEAAQLKKLGYHIRIAHNAADAIETVETHPDIRLILMDIDLGRGSPDGTEAAAEILSRHQVPVVFLSSHTEPEIVEKTEKISSYGYIVKNSGINVLDRSIQMALKLFDAHQELKKHQAEAEEAYWEMERREERLQHINRILLSIRNVNQLITRETNSQELLAGTCRLLIETNGYHNASIVLLKNGIPREPFFHAGTHRNYPAMEEELRKGHIPPCIVEALQKGGIIVMNSAHRECSGCPLMDNPGKKGCMDESKAGFTSRLEYNGKVCGWLMVTLPKGYSRDPDEHRLFEEITGDISYALHSLKLAEEKAEADRLLAEKEGRLRMVLEKLPVPALLSSGRIEKLELVNAKFVEVFGYTLEDMPDVQHWWPLAYPEEEYRKEVISRWEENLDHAMEENGELDPLPVWVTCKDGSRRYVVVRAYTLGDLNIVVFLDMTAQEEALRERDSLMRELNHRVKNNLTMITSLISLKEAAMGGVADLSDLRHQIEAILTLHEKLFSAGTVTEVEIGSYLRDLLDLIFSNFTEKKVRLQTDIDELLVETRTAIPLGLLVNEIATNAVKYGFSAGEEPLFCLSLHRDDPSGQYVMRLSNTGAPFPEDIGFDHPDTLGLQLISSLVSQLRGRIELRRRPEPEFTVYFPL